MHFRLRYCGMFVVQGLGMLMWRFKRRKNRLQWMTRQNIQGRLNRQGKCKVNAQVALEKKDTTLGIGVLTDNDWGDIIKSVLRQAKPTGLIRAIIAKLATLESDWWLTFERKNTSLNRHGIRYVSSWGVMTVWTNFYHHLPIENQLRQWLELF